MRPFIIAILLLQAMAMHGQDLSFAFVDSLNTDTTLTDTTTIDSTIADTSIVDTTTPVKNIPFSNQIIDDTKKWNLLKGSILSTANKECCFTTRGYKFGVTASVGTQTYTTIDYSNSVDENNWQLGGFFRESNKKVFFRTTTVREGLVYDFGASKGDSIHVKNAYFGKDSFLVVVSNIDTLEIAGNLKKRFYISDTSGKKVIDTWIEGMGSMHGLLNSCYTLYQDDGYWRKLLCFKANDELAYQHKSYDRCFIEGLTGNTVVENALQELLIYPNPSREVIYLNPSVSLQSEKDLSFHIYQSTGSLVLSGTIDEVSSGIDIGNMPAGIYFFMLFSRQDVLGQSKIVIQ